MTGAPPVLRKTAAATLQTRSSPSAAVAALGGTIAVAGFEITREMFAVQVAEQGYGFLEG